MDNVSLAACKFAPRATLAFLFKGIKNLRVEVSISCNLCNLNVQKSILISTFFAFGFLKNGPRFLPNQAV